MAHIKSYVLRTGRTSNAQRRSYETLMPRYGIPFSGEVTDYRKVFDNDNPVTVEIGFGMGLATALIAEANPGGNYLGIEVHRPGIGRLLWEIENRGLRNIRIIEYDAVEVLERMIGRSSVAAFHIFFPDPWPKKRHHKRRLITRPFTFLLAEALRPGGYIYVVTDWADYGDWALAELSAVPELENAYGGSAGGGVGGFAGGFAPPQPWRPRTKFEAKGLLKNHEIRELYFTRKAGL